MTILFAEDLATFFDELPERVKRRAARSMDLLITQPRMYPMRERGIMRGYRYFVAERYLFFYSHSEDEIRIAAIIPAVMKRA